MFDSANKHFIFLLSAVVSADATPARKNGGRPGLSAAKRQQMDAVLGKWYADLDDDGRKALVRDSLRGMPPIKGGIAFLKRVERSSQKLSASFDRDQKTAYRVVKALKSVAERDGVSPQELHVLRTISNNLGLHGKLKIEQAADQIQLTRC